MSRPVKHIHDCDITKLPKWAQVHLGNLQRKIDHQQEQLEAMLVGDSENTHLEVLDPNSGRIKELPLLRGRVRFSLQSGVKITAFVSDGKLQIVSDYHRMTIAPRSGNYIEVY